MLKTKATKIKNKIPGITNLAPKAALNEKAAEVETKIPEITNLATKAVLNTKAKEIENKILDDTGLFTTQEFSRLRKISFEGKMKEAAKSLASRSRVDTAFDIADKKKGTVKKCKRLTEVISQTKVILKTMECKIIQCLNQVSNTLSFLVLKVI